MCRLLSDLVKLKIHAKFRVAIKPEPNVLKILPIIASSTSQNLSIILISYHYLLILYYSLH